jgi:hypothetical protein
MRCVIGSYPVNLVYHSYQKICNFSRIKNRRAVRSLPQLMIQEPPGPDTVAGTRGSLACQLAVRGAGGSGA